MQYHVLTGTRYIAWEIKMKVSIQAHEAMITIHHTILEEILLSITETKMEKEVETLKTMYMGIDQLWTTKVQSFIKVEFEILSMKEAEMNDDLYTKISNIQT